MTTRVGIRCEFRKGGSDGVCAKLFAEGYTDEQIEQAKREVRKHRDVVSFIVRRESR